MSVISMQMVMDIQTEIDQILHILIEEDHIIQGIITMVVEPEDAHLDHVMTEIWMNRDNI